jgi:hypothetical protein
LIKDGENPKVICGNATSGQSSRKELKDLEPGHYYMYCEIDLKDESKPAEIDSAVNIYCN